MYKWIERCESYFNNNSEEWKSQEWKDLSGSSNDSKRRDLAKDLWLPLNSDWKTICQTEDKNRQEEARKLWMQIDSSRYDIREERQRHDKKNLDRLISELNLPAWTPEHIVNYVIEARIYGFPDSYAFSENWLKLIKQERRYWIDRLWVNWWAPEVVKIIKSGFSWYVPELRKEFEERKLTLQTRYK